MNFLEYSEIVSLIILTCDSVILHKQRREFLSTKYEKKISEVQNLTNFFVCFDFGALNLSRILTNEESRALSFLSHCISLFLTS